MKLSLGLKREAGESQDHRKGAFTWAKQTEILFIQGTALFHRRSQIDNGLSFSSMGFSWLEGDAATQAS